MSHTIGHVPNESNMAAKFLFVLSCFVFLSPGYSSAICAPVNYDITVLEEVHVWRFEFENAHGCNPINKTGSNCVFFFSVCHEVPVLCPSNSAICLTNQLIEDKNRSFYSKPLMLGSSDIQGFVSERNRFTLTIGPSASPNVTFVFKCNKNVVWNSSSFAEVGVKVPEAPFLQFENHTNLYKIEFNASFACESGGGGGGGGGGSGGDSIPRSLSVGSILLILFFPGLFLYFVVGILINRSSGKTGKDMIPNSKFWMDLPGLIVDGFSFCIAKLTCSKMSTTSENYDRM